MVRLARAAVAAAQVLVLALSLALAVGAGIEAPRPTATISSRCPGRSAHHVPGLENARLPRIALYASLAAAIVVALWTATTRGRFFPRPFVLPVLAVVALMPALDEPMYVGHHERVPFFTDGLIGRASGPTRTSPSSRTGMRATRCCGRRRAASASGSQAATSTRSSLDGPSLTSFDDDPTVEALNFRSDTARPRMTSLLALAGSHGIDRFVAVDGAGYPSERQLRALGPVQRIGGVLVAPACGSAPLTSRDLDRYVEVAGAGRRSPTASTGTSTRFLPASTRPA